MMRPAAGNPFSGTFESGDTIVLRQEIKEMSNEK